MNFTLTVPAGHHAGACASKDGRGRFVMEGAAFVRLSDTAGLILSTNGKAASILQVDCAGKPPTQALLPAAPLKANGKNLTVAVNGEVRAMNGKKTTVHEMPAQEGRWPHLKGVLPKPADLEGRTPLCLDAKLLVELAAAITPTGSVALFPDGDKVCAVIGLEDDVARGIGVLVPLSFKKDTSVSWLEQYKALFEALPNSGISFNPPPAPIQEPTPEPAGVA